jgi:tetratricopeptide (TPR) repeat protein
VICDYETGRRRTLRRETFDRLVSAMGYGTEEVDLAVLFFTALRGWPEGQVNPVDLSVREEKRIRWIAARMALLEAGRIASRLRARAREQHIAKARREAAALWEVLRLETPAGQHKAIESRFGLCTWAMVEHICDESVVAAGKNPAQAMRLARLAVAVAERIPGEAGWRSRVTGYAKAFEGNALRTAANLPAAEMAFAAAWRHWRSNVSGSPVPLAEWRLFDLEASLRKDQRQFEVALDLVEQARAAAPARKRGRLLLLRASILEQAWRVQESLEVLREAAPLIDAEGNARDRAGVRFNLVVGLCHLGRCAEARELLPEVHTLMMALQSKADRRRYDWVAARVAAGLGHRAEARRIFSRLAREFEAQRNAFDAALVTLDQAVLEFEDGRVEQAKALSEKLVWVLDSQRLSREALAALQLFLSAVRAGTAEIELARRVLRFVERSRHDPALRFEATE